MGLGTGRAYVIVISDGNTDYDAALRHNYPSSRFLHLLSEQLCAANKT